MYSSELMVGSKVPQMLDLKLALYLPYCGLMKSGVFVTCADDIETYHLDVTDLGGPDKQCVVLM